MANIDRQKLLERIEQEATARYDAYQRGRDEKPPRDTEDRTAYRHRLARQNRAIVNERLIGESDLLEINYLERGLRASRTVCRIQIRNQSGHVVGHGTGCLVSPRLLLTNQHVLLDFTEAQHSLAEFNYEDDVFLRPKTPAVFKLAPHVLYLSDEDRDFALVAVEPNALDGTTSLQEFGYIKLRPQSGKALIGENVGIIQHPSGASKKIAVRANKIVGVRDHFIHYQTDTEPGSSGSPVFSDEWEVVALHHASVKDRDEQGRVLNRDGGIWQPEQGEDAIKWKANEGVRISAIIERLRAELERVDDRNERLLMQDVIRDADVASGPYIVVRGDVAEERRSGGWYTQAQGYDSGFLGDEAVLDLPELQLSPQDAQDELLYRHFSIVLSRSRRQAIFTACNIDGDLLVSDSRSIGWKTDPRLEDGDQIDNEFYKDQPGRTNPLDRGHLVRRLDPSWGDIAVEAIDDTFHFTNAALQHRSFNNGIWGRLEDALLARAGRTWMTVFTGPILSVGDPIMRVPRNGGVDEAQVPLEFWKVIAFATDEGFLAAAGFRQSQAGVIGNMNLDFTVEPERVFEAHIDTLLTHQVPISQIENATGLSFHYLRDYDATPEELEAERPRIVRGPSDLILRRPQKERRIRGAGDQYTARMTPPITQAELPRKKPKAKKARIKTKR